MSEPAWKGEPDAGRDHRCSSSVDGLDDLVGVDALQVDRGDAEVAVAELALDDVERDAFAASSMAWAWRSWCGAKRRRTPARAASRRSIARAGAGCHGRPRRLPIKTTVGHPAV